MSWKDKPYWLKGGIIGLIYSFVIALFNLFIIFKTSDPTAQGFGQILLNIFLNFPTLMVFNLIEPIFSYANEILVIVLLSFPINFIIGAIIDENLMKVLRALNFKPTDDF